MASRRPYRVALGRVQQSAHEPDVLKRLERSETIIAVARGGSRLCLVPAVEASPRAPAVLP